jgi:biopolymer transport protein ExbD
MQMATGGGSSMQSDINITPLIDVLLVLLVIFMITQPMLRKVLDIQVPVEEPATSEPVNTNTIVLEIKDDGTYAINTQPVVHDQLLARLHEIYDVRSEKLLFLKVGQQRKYRDVINAIDVARAAGVKVFGLAPPETAAPAG